jgi:hypothetical protein
VKRCSLCGRQFPDNYLYCDQDATPLPASGRRLSAWLVAAGILVALLLAAVVAGPGQVRRYIGNHIIVEVVGVSLGHGALSWLPGDVELNLRVHNSSMFSPSLRSLRLECSLGSQSAVALEWPSGPSPELPVAAGGDTDLPLKVSPRHIDPESILSGLKGQPEIDCKGPADFAVWGIGFSQQLDFQRKL